MSESESLESSGVMNVHAIPVAQVRHLALLPSTSWDDACPATLRDLVRQKRRAETELGLQAVIVQDERGFVALWTGELHASYPEEREASDVTEKRFLTRKATDGSQMRDRQRYA